jgi:hypothetical protein
MTELQRTEASNMKHHVHPETYSETDSLDVRRYQLHTRRDICELTWCTFADLYESAQQRYIDLAKSLKQEIKAAEPHCGWCAQPDSKCERCRECGQHGCVIDGRCAFCHPEPVCCAVCGERLTLISIDSGQVAEMFDPTDETMQRCGIVHAECGLSNGWEIA